MTSYTTTHDSTVIEHRWYLCLATAALAVTSLLHAGCSGPCDKACEQLVRSCQLTVDSYSAAPDPDQPRGCKDVEPSSRLSEAICQEQCQDWAAEGAECVADLSCSDDVSANRDKYQDCLQGLGRDHNEREETSGDKVSDCRQDCDKQGLACSDACRTTSGDTPTCAGCFDNCDKSRARCRSWCEIIGQ